MRIPISQGHLEIMRAGNGEPALLITGLGGRASFWSRQIAALSKRFDVIAFDQRGIGGSSPLAGACTVEGLARDTLELLDALGVGRCHVIGHSTGGAIAQVIAEDHPQRVARLVLSGTWCAPTAPFSALFRLRKRLLAELGPEVYTLHGALVSWPDDWLEAHPELLAPASGAAEAAVTLARLEAILAFSRAEKLSSIGAPTLVVCAQDDRLVPPGHSRRIAGAIAGSILRLLPYGGHFPQVTASDAYNALVTDFLENPL